MPNERNGTDLARDKESAKAVEAGLAMHLRVKADLDEVRRQNVELLELLTRSKVEIEALRSFNNLLESRINGAIAERDLAIGQRAKLAALLGIMHTAMHEAAIEAFTNEMEPANGVENAAR